MADSHESYFDPIALLAEDAVGWNTASSGTVLLRWLPQPAGHGQQARPLHTTV
jgi:hypothetical protein